MAVPEVAPDLHCGDGIACYWTNRAVAPWQTQEWLDQMRLSLRANQYLRMIENRFVSTESTFVEMDWWDDCVNEELRPVLSDRSISAWLGVDASVKRDSTAIVACTWDTEAKRARLLWHRIFQPSKTDPLDFEATIERTLLECRERFDVREVRYDPYQMAAVAQRLIGAGLPMIEFPQSVPNLTAASTNLYEIITGRNLAAYPDEDIRLAISRSVAIETSRGWRIAKEKISHKIVAALAQAALGAVQGGQIGDPNIMQFYESRLARAFRDEGKSVNQIAVQLDRTQEQVTAWLDDSTEDEMVRIYEEESMRLAGLSKSTTYGERDSLTAATNRLLDEVRRGK
jgi:hypothetical protein